MSARINGDNNMNNYNHSYSNVESGFEDYKEDPPQSLIVKEPLTQPILHQDDEEYHESVDRNNTNNSNNTNQNQTRSPLFLSEKSGESNTGSSFSANDRSNKLVRFKQYCKNKTRNLLNYINGNTINNYERVVWLDGRIHPETFKSSNAVSYAKYNLVTFFPKFFYQFLSQFPNSFLVFIAISQFFYDLKVGHLYCYIAPPIAFLVFLIFREGYDDFRRRKSEIGFNEIGFKVLTKNSDGTWEYQNKLRKELKVGDVIELPKGVLAPADLVILYSNNLRGEVLVNTQQFDGRTLHAQKTSIQWIQNEMLRRNHDPTIVANLSAKVSLPAPSPDVIGFTGTFISPTATHSLNVSNMIWADCSLSSGCILGLVAYCGHECKSEMASGKNRYKVCKLDKEVSMLSKVLCGVFVVYAILIVFIKGNIFSSASVIIDFIRFFVLVSCITPANLRIQVEICRLFSTYSINTDPELPGVQIKDQNIPEELGQIHYLIADKTGTLTENQMKCQRISMEQVTFNEETMMEMESIIINQCSRYAEPLSNYPNDLNSSNRPKEEVFRDLVTAMCICNSVQPYKTASSQSQFLGISQDEVAIVKLAEQLGISLIHRSEDEIRLCNIRGGIETYRVLEIYPYNNVTKRMSIIVQYIDSGRIVLYTKGITSEMVDLLQERNAIKFAQEETASLSSEGLRVITYAQKLLLPKQYHEWRTHKYSSGSVSISHSVAAGAAIVPRSISLSSTSKNSPIDGDMEFLGMTALNDQLREDVPLVIETLELAGITVWIATGDSMEQAMSTAIQSGIKKTDQHFHLVQGVCDDIDIKAKLQYIDGDKNSKKSILVIDGDSLNLAMNVAEKQLVKVCITAASVLFCKCSGLQKSQIVELMKKHTQYRIAALGDGANDVAMIRSAHIGIGLRDRDYDTQAANAADICIDSISSLSRLFLWHGRRSYKRNVDICSFVLQRGLVISFIELIFVAVFYTISLQIFNGKLLLAYTLLFTTLPTLTIILNQDLDFDTCMEFPQIYRSAQKGRSLNLRTFFSWLWKSVFQGTALMMMILTWFWREYFLNIETYAFFALIVSDYFSLFVKISSIKKLTWTQLSLIGVSIIIYLMVLLFLQDQFDIGDIWSFKTLFPLIGIVLTSWAPLYGINLLRMRIDPTEDERILKNAQRSQLRDELQGE